MLFKRPLAELLMQAVLFVAIVGLIFGTAHHLFDSAQAAKASQLAPATHEVYIVGDIGGSVDSDFWFVAVSADVTAQVDPDHYWEGTNFDREACARLATSGLRFLASTAFPSAELDERSATVDAAAKIASFWSSVYVQNNREWTPCIHHPLRNMQVFVSKDLDSLRR